MLSNSSGILRILFFLPALLFVVVFVFYPAIHTVCTSFFTPDGKFAPLSSYAAALGRREVKAALIHNFVWIAIHLPVTLLGGLVLAVLLMHVKGRNFIRPMIVLGMVTPTAVGGLIVRFIFDRRLGIVPAFLTLFGVSPKSWISYPETALFALILGSVWLWTGFSFVLHLAGLQTIPRDYYDAAKVDGATPWRSFFAITLPLLRPVTLVVAVLTIIWELKIFALVYTATMGGPGLATNVLALQMFTDAFQRFDFNSGSVVATLLLILVMVFAIPLIWRSAR